MAKYSYNVSVSTIANADRRFTNKFYPGYISSKPLTGTLDYPLDVKVTFPITAFNKRWGISEGDVLWCASKAYKQVYKNPDKYGVWGHSMNQLAFEGFRVKGNKVKFDIGS